MRRLRLDFVCIYRLLQTFLRNKTSPSSPECEKHRGYPDTYDDTLILALRLFQTLWQLSYRETLETVSKAGFSVPALSTYHYRIRKIPISVLQELLEQTGEALFRRHKGKWRSLMVDGTEQRSIRIEMVSSVRLVLLVVVDDKGKAVVLGEAVGSPYASEVEPLRRILARKSASIEADFPSGLGRMGIAKVQDRRVFGSIKIKVNSVFPLFREDLAMKRALAAAVLYNLNLLAILTIILIKAHIIIYFLFIPSISTSLHIFHFSNTLNNFLTWF